MRVVVDVETNGLNNYTLLHCVVVQDIDTDETYTFIGEECKKLPELLNRCELIIGHGFINFDWIVLRDLLGHRINPERIFDTLIGSRLLNFQLADGHSLEAWGVRLGIPKQGLSVYFESFSPELLSRCISDCKINVALYKHLMHPKKLGSDAFKKAIEVEHKCAFICLEMKENGFAFDISKAKSLYSEIQTQVKSLDIEILAAFPPKAKLLREVTPKATKFGTISKTDFRWFKGEDLSLFSVGCPFSLVSFEPFNPGSSSQIIERLNEAGWNPTSKTKGHIEAERTGNKERLKKFKVTGWKVDEENLSTLPDTAPEGARKLVERLLLASRLRTLDEWFQAYRSDSGRIHGTVTPLGTYTHRASHKEPNTGNIAAEKSIKYKGRDLKSLATNLGGRMRSLWTASPGKVLVGTDAEGIQLRIFGHYINDKKFIEAVTSGKKEDGTDPHSLNGRILEASRDTSKTFIFAFLLGAGDGKVADILGRTKSAGKDIKQRFINSYPGLAKLKRTIIPREAALGYTRAVDGRYIVCDSEHLMMAVYLQSGEAILMKHAMVKWYEKLKREDIDFKLVGFVHDEFITECSPSVAEYIGQVQREAITEAGRDLELRCPMSGETKIGKNWLEAH